jgi:multicomponent Na+:H+ antiporter subunit F
MATALLTVAACLLLTLPLALVRLLRGPTGADRVLAVTLAGTTVAAVLLLVGFSVEEPALLDVALAFALLAAVPVLVFAERVARGDDR